MSKNIEIEAKELITKEDYERLFNKYSKTYSTYVQINYLLHPSDKPIDDKSIAVRIRERNKSYEFTCKINHDEGKLEINQVISDGDFNLFMNKHIVPKGEVYDELQKRNICNPDKLKLLAILKTKRFDIPYKGGLLSIDKSEYLDVVDYEIEYESTSMERAVKTLKEFLKNEKIPYRGKSKSKLKRVKERYSLSHSSPSSQQ